MLKLSVALVAVLIALAGCGGGDDDEGSTTKSEFIAQADEVCEEADRRLNPLGDAADADLERGDTEGAVGEFRKAIPIAHQVLQKLRGLDRPADDALIRQYIDGTAEQIGLLRQVTDALEEKDYGRIASLGDELDAGEADLKDLAQGYGFTECGSGD